MIPLVPAIIPKSKNTLESSLEKLNFASEIHVDVVDGKFVPFLSWPYEPQGLPVEIKENTDKFTLEVDLMVEAPLLAAESWLEAGADMLVFHVESISLPDFKNFVHSAPASVGISALNDTPIEILSSYLEIADYVQVMGIAKIGVQGQAFDYRVLERIKFIKNHFSNKHITVDGSVNKNTIQTLKSSGADRMIVGSAVTLSEKPYESYLDLIKLIN